MNREELIREFDAEIDELMRGRSGEDAKQTAIGAKRVAERIVDFVASLLGEDIPSPHHVIFLAFNPFNASGNASIVWQFQLIPSAENRPETEEATFPDASNSKSDVSFSFDIFPRGDKEDIYFTILHATEPIYGPVKYGLDLSRSMRIKLFHNDSPKSRSNKIGIIRGLAREILEYDKLTNWTVPPRA